MRSVLAKTLIETATTRHPFYGRDETLRSQFEFGFFHRGAVSLPLGLYHTLVNMNAESGCVGLLFVRNGISALLDIIHGTEPSHFGGNDDSGFIDAGRQDNFGEGGSI